MYSGHGITEALRLKNLRSNQRIEKAKRQFDQVRWGGAGEEGGRGEVKQGARMDAVIERMYSPLHLPPPHPQTSSLYAFEAQSSGDRLTNVRVREDIEIASFDFSAPTSDIPNGKGSAQSATHPPVETRKKKGAGAKKRGKGKPAGFRQGELVVLKRAADAEMRDAHLQPQPQQLWEQQMQKQASSGGASASGGDMSVDAG